MKYALFIFALLMTGCATPLFQDYKEDYGPTEEKLDKKLASWLDQSSTQLVMAWGAPARIVDTGNGMKVYEYINVGATRSTAYAIPGMNMVNAQSGTDYCKVTFVADSANIVRSWRREGNICRSE